MTQKIILTTLSDYPEVPVSEGEMLINETGSWRFASPAFSPRPSPCSRACPLENDIPGIMRRFAEGDIEGAADTFSWEDPFPALLGRVCPGFCMADCNRAHFDERVSIRDIERFVGDRFSRQGPPVEGERTGKSVAIVGSGPAGLSAALFPRDDGARRHHIRERARYRRYPPAGYPRLPASAKSYGRRGLAGAHHGRDNQDGACDTARRPRRPLVFSRRAVYRPGRAYVGADGDRG